MKFTEHELSQLPALRAWWAGLGQMAKQASPRDGLPLHWQRVEAKASIPGRPRPLPMIDLRAFAKADSTEQAAIMAAWAAGQIHLPGVTVCRRPVVDGRPVDLASAASIAADFEVCLGRAKRVTKAVKQAAASAAASIAAAEAAGESA